MTRSSVGKSRKFLLYSLFLTIRTSDGLMFRHRRARNANAAFLLKESMLAALVICSLHLLPCAASDFQCPQNFETQSLGVQNIIVSSPSDSKNRKISGMGKPHSITPTICNNRASESKDLELNEAIQGLIYLPSMISSRASLEASQVVGSGGALVITASPTDHPSVLVAGARIPLSDIHAFPISFRLSKDNIFTKSSQQRIVNSYASKDLYIVARICPKEHPYCEDSDSIFQGRGIARLLVLPAGDDTEMNVRAAASIRLSELSTPDLLTAW